MTATKTRAARNAVSPRITADEIKALAEAFAEAVTAEAEAASLATFARRHGISLSFVYKLIDQGLGPQTFRAGARVMVTKESAAQWRRAREADRTS